MGLGWDFDADRPDVLTWLQAWYSAQCDGDWEHGSGIKIETLDNPGWWVEIDLEGTSLEAAQLERVEMRRSADDWSVTWLDGATFHAACGPANLTEALHTFRRFVTAEDDRGRLIVVSDTTQTAPPAPPSDIRLPGSAPDQLDRRED